MWHFLGEATFEFLMWERGVEIITLGHALTLALERAACSLSLASCVLLHNKVCCAAQYLGGFILDSLPLIPPFPHHLEV
jgi:hypothetical protein